MSESTASDPDPTYDSDSDFDDDDHAGGRPLRSLAAIIGVLYRDSDSESDRALSSSRQSVTVLHSEPQAATGDLIWLRVRRA